MAIPCALVVKESIGPLLKLLGDSLGLFMALEPSLVLLVETPALVLECLGCEILLIRALLVVEDVKERIRVDTSV